MWITGTGRSPPPQVNGHAGCVWSQLASTVHPHVAEIRFHRDKLKSYLIPVNQVMLFWSCSAGAYDGDYYVLIIAPPQKSLHIVVAL